MLELNLREGVPMESKRNGCILISHILITMLKPHPDNPRPFLREDVILSIEAQIKERGGFDESHALRVRRLSDNTYQIISGHHRVEAAKRAGLKEVPCFVLELTDEEAKDELLYSNSQSELAPLEIGLYLLKTVGRGHAGRGNKSGIAKHARIMHATRESYQQYLNAAEVAVKYGNRFPDLRDNYTTSLAIIHRCPESDWADLVTRMLAEQWTKGQTECQVNIVKRRRECLAAAAAVKYNQCQRFHPGDWRAHLDRLRDSSIKLLLLDPPYDGDEPVQEISACLEAMYPKLASDAHLFVFCPRDDWHSEMAVKDALPRLGYKPCDTWGWIHGVDPDEDEVWDHQDFLSACLPILYAVKGSPTLLCDPQVTAPKSAALYHARIPQPIHPAEKPVLLLEQLIDATTIEGELVADPYAGVASTLVAAQQSQRNYWGCELDEGYYRAGAYRLASAVDTAGANRLKLADRVREARVELRAEMLKLRNPTNVFYAMPVTPPTTP
ncbi:MAG: DNA methyltransferase [Silvibacterium sp.]